MASSVNVDAINTAMSVSLLNRQQIPELVPLVAEFQHRRTGQNATDAEIAHFMHHWSDQADQQRRCFLYHTDGFLGGFCCAQVIADLESLVNVAEARFLFVLEGVSDQSGAAAALLSACWHYAKREHCSRLQLASDAEDEQTLTLMRNFAAQECQQIRFSIPVSNAASAA